MYMYIFIFMYTYLLYIYIYVCVRVRAPNRSRRASQRQGIAGGSVCGGGPGWLMDCAAVLAAALAVSFLWFAACLPALWAIALPQLPQPYLSLSEAERGRFALLSAVSHAAAVAIGLAIGAQTRPLAPAARAAESVRVWLLLFGAVCGAALLAYRHAEAQAGPGGHWAASILGAPWSILGAPWSIMGAPWSIMAAPWEALGVGPGAVFAHIEDGPGMPNKSFYDPRKWWDNVYRGRATSSSGATSASSSYDWCASGWPVECWWASNADALAQGWDGNRSPTGSENRLARSEKRPTAASAGAALFDPDGALPFALVAAASFSSWLAVSMALQVIRSIHTHTHTHTHTHNSPIMMPTFKGTMTSLL